MLFPDENVMLALPSDYMKENKNILLVKMIQPSNSFSDESNSTVMAEG